MNTDSGEHQILWQQDFAEDSGLAIIITDKNSKSLVEANNNSMCRFLYESEEFEPQCAEFCGKAFEKAHETGKSVPYRCYAGLNCVAAPFESGGKPLVAIVGRTFLKAEKYREATERAMGGDWKDFPSADFFDNVLLSSSSQKIGQVARQIENLSAEEKDLILKNTENTKTGGEILSSKNQTEETAEIGKMIGHFQASENRNEKSADEITKRNRRESVETYEWRKLFGSLLALSYRQACAAVLNFISERYKLESLAWLELKENHLEKVTATGNLKNQPLNIGIPVNDRRVLKAARSETALEMHEKNKTGESQKISFFPINIGDEVRSALIVGGETPNEQTQRYIAKFSRSVASELEILRLREELSRRVWLDSGIKKFNDSLAAIDEDEFLVNFLQNLAELLNAERGSFLSFDSEANKLEIKSAIGKNADKLKKIKEGIGERAARKILQNARPLLAQNAELVLNAPAPTERNYKTNSFIGFPVSIGERKIGVLNFTDKTGRKTFDEYDLQLLKSLSPQIAVAIDRAVLKREAGELKQLSVTDALTGLLNRRYLEERLSEEIKRSNRYGYPMSFLMIDVDDFKSFNDTFSHPEGDKALKLVASGLKDTLRGADVAARYGGEEFSILLPQTTSEEAEIIAERIRKKVFETKFPNRQVTISIGIASSSLALNSVESVISAADKALYEAKRQGRNNVQVYENLGKRDEGKGIRD